MVYVDVIARYAQKKAFENKLDALGHVKHENWEDRKESRQRPGFMGGEGTDINGVMYRRLRLLPEDINKFSNNAHNPAFAIVWRSIEFDDDGNLLPLEPETTYTVNITDPETNEITGTREQPVGGF